MIDDLKIAGSQALYIIVLNGIKPKSVPKVVKTNTSKNKKKKQKQYMNNH